MLMLKVFNLLWLAGRAPSRVMRSFFLMPSRMKKLS